MLSTQNTSFLLTSSYKELNVNVKIEKHEKNARKQRKFDAYI